MSVHYCNYCFVKVWVHVFYTKFTKKYCSVQCLRTLIVIQLNPLALCMEYMSTFVNARPIFVIYAFKLTTYFLYVSINVILTFNNHNEIVRVTVGRHQESLISNSLVFFSQAYNHTTVMYIFFSNAMVLLIETCFATQRCLFYGQNLYYDIMINI